MHAVKVTCLGQTFALANSGDSGGKKSRIRRSKEERKDMVVSFIKKYQNSNDGSFPSLNLTHKEVGGSFYTVREIVREVIQENRVLGPAKLTLDEQNNDELSEQYPLGSISTQPQNDLCLSSNETHFVSHTTSVELISTLSGQVNGKRQHIFDDGKYNNEILVDKECTETDETKSSGSVKDEMQYTDVEVSHKLEGKSKGVEEIVQAPTSKVTPIATDVIVETFPLASSPKQKQGRDGRPDEPTYLTRTLEEHEAKKVEEASATVKTDPVLEKVVELENQSSGSRDKKSAVIPVDPFFESLICSTSGKSVTSSIVEDTEVQVDASSTDVLTLQTSHQNQVVPGVEPKHALNGTCTQNNNAKVSKSTSRESLSPAAVVETKTDTQDIHITKEERNSTLNQINLESWDGASNKPSEGEVNPAWAVFKAFITAFVKFWTE